jgi:hypothetical protein
MPPVRPGAVTAAGVLSIIYGGLFSLCGLVGVAGLAAQGGAGQNMFPGGADPNQEKFQKELEKRLERDAPAFQTFQGASTVLGLVGALALFSGGIGLLGMHPWARTLTLVAALLTMVVTAIQLGYMVAYFIPAMNDSLQAVMPAILQQQGAGQQEQQAMRVIETIVMLFIIGIIFFYVLIMIYLFIIVMLLRRQHVRAAFAGEAPPAWNDDTTERLDYKERRSSEQEDDGWGASGPPRNPDDDYRYR